MLRATVRFHLTAAVKHPIKTNARSKVIGVHSDQVCVTLSTSGASSYTIWEDTTHRDSIKKDPDDPSGRDEASLMGEKFSNDIEDALGVSLGLEFTEGLAREIREVLITSGGLR